MDWKSARPGQNVDDRRYQSPYPALTQSYKEMFSDAILADMFYSGIPNNWREQLIRQALGRPDPNFYLANRAVDRGDRMLDNTLDTSGISPAVRSMRRPELFSNPIIRGLGGR